MPECYRCKRFLSPQQQWLLGGTKADGTHWHMVNLAANAAGSVPSFMVPVCDDCDPPPIFLGKSMPPTPEMIEWAKSILAKTHSK